jgi:hypothetical protein
MSLFGACFKSYNDLTSLHTLFSFPLITNPLGVPCKPSFQDHFLKKLFLHLFDVVQTY